MKWDKTQGIGDPGNCKKICPVCNKVIYDKYPWFDKNPDKYKDAIAYHEDCFFVKKLNLFDTYTDFHDYAKKLKDLRFGI